MRDGIDNTNVVGVEISRELIGVKLNRLPISVIKDVFSRLTKYRRRIML